MRSSQPTAQEAPISAPPEQGSRRRWVVLALIFSITVINFIDRQTLSVLAPVLRATYHLSNEAYGRIVAALQFGMMSGEFPMGWLMDRIGARLGLTAAVLWWSAATGSQVFTRTGLQLGATRLWMGTGEAGNYSGGMKAVSRFFSQGPADACDWHLQQRQHDWRDDCAAADCISDAAVWIPRSVSGSRDSWERSGYRCGGFCIRARTGHRGSRTRQRRSCRFGCLLKQSSAWAVMMCRFFIGPVMQFYWYWIPSYLYSVRHMSLTQIGILGWIPFFLGDSGGVFGGWAAGWLQKRKLNIYHVRQITMYGSSLLCITQSAWCRICTTACRGVVHDRHRGDGGQFSFCEHVWRDYGFIS